MKRFTMLLSLLVVAGSTGSFPAAAATRVVTTLPSLAALAAAGGGEHVSVEALASASQDPHFADARPDLIVKLNRADLLVVNGLELESGWLPALQTSARNPKILVGGEGNLDASKFVRLLEVPTRVIDRSMGDIHPGGNPHFLFDPRSAAAVARAIGERLAILDPEHADSFRANATKTSEELTAFASQQSARFAALTPKQRRVVCYHKSMQYLEDWLKLEEVVTVEPKPGSPPDPAHVARVVQTMRESGARVILQEEFYPRHTSETIARLTGATLVVIEGGVRFREGEVYLAHLRTLTNHLYAALSGAGEGE